jgi:hypothetical protein
MKPEAIRRALRQLRKLESFNYVPPFRGRAIQVVRRDRPFHELPIDFELLEKRKANEFAKLEQVIDYATTRGCRQLKILRYFGDPAARRCGACDNCGGVPRLEPEPESLPDDNQQLLQCVRIALSGVARVQGRVGKLMVAKMLCGSKSQQIGRLQLDKLSTFGLLRDLRQTEATELLDALIRARLVQQKETQRMRPVVKLTDDGRQVMLGHSPLGRPLAIAPMLRQRLRQLSLPAATAGSLPAEAAADATPPKGRSQTAEQASTGSSEPVSIEGQVDHTTRPSWYWTWRVLAAGCSLAECEQIRQLDRTAIVRHLLEAVRSGLRVSFDWVLDESQQTAWGQLAAQSAPLSRDHAAQVLDAEQLQLWRACRNQRP